MKKLFNVALIAIGALVAGVAFAQSAATDEAQRKIASTVTVYHAGGPRHDQRGHEATLRAREKGQKVEAVTFHSGGRHDAWGHEAAMRAEQRQGPASEERR